MKVGEFEFKKRANDRIVARTRNGAHPRATTRPAHGALVSWGFFLLRLTSPASEIRT